MGASRAALRCDRLHRRRIPFSKPHRNHDIPGEPRNGFATDVDLNFGWSLVNRGEPTEGQLFLQFEGRSSHGFFPAGDLGENGLGSLITTADSFNDYTPTFIARNFYWQQGSRSAKWIYRFGKITTDQILNTTSHLSPNTTFLPSGHVGAAAIAMPDSGLGITASWFPNERFYVNGLISDANGDRFGIGDISVGDFFKSVEFGFNLSPEKQRVGHSKLTLWHTDGTKDGLSNNLSLGPSGYGYTLRVEDALSRDGRLIGVARIGQSFNGAALYERQATAHLLFYEPLYPLRSRANVTNDLFGIGFSWADTAIPGAQIERSVEAFYRVPLVPNFVTTFSLQYVKNPARAPLLGSNIDEALVFSVRARIEF